MSIVKSERIPPLNPVKFIPSADSLALGSNTFPFDQGFFKEQIRNYQTEVDYQQKWNYNDRIVIYLDTLAPAIIIHIYNDSGKNLTSTIVASPSYVLAGNVYTRGFTDYQYNTFLASFKPSLLAAYMFPSGATSGFFYFVIEAVYVSAGDADSVYYTSEPQFIRKYGFPDTMLVKATNTLNNYDVLFEQLSPVFQYRVEADVTNFAPFFKDTVFEDQQYEVRKLQSVPYRNFTFIIGDYQGVPPYAIDKINRALSCDSFKIDGVRYVKEISNNTYNMKTADSYPMAAATMLLREYDHDAGWNFPTGEFVQLLALPNIAGVIQYPFGFTHVNMHGTAIVNYTQSTVIEDAGGLATFLTLINGAFAAANDLEGSYSVIGTSFGYTCGPDESFAASTQNYAFSPYLAFDVETTGIAGTFDWTFKGPGIGGSAGICVVDFGDGTPNVTTFIAAGSTTRTVSHSYAGATGTHYTMRIFHAGPSLSAFTAITYLSFSAFYNAIIKEVIPTATLPGVAAPGRLGIFGINYQDLSGSTVDLTWLDGCAPYLTYMTMASNKMTGCIIFPGPIPFPNLATVLFQLNNLSVIWVSDIAYAFYHDAFAGLIFGGIFYIDGQTPAAPPAGAGLAALNALVSIYAWTVLHD
jgi:hypothetical protein